MSQSACAAIAERHRLGDLKNRNLFSHSSGCWKSKIKVPVDLDADEDTLSGFQKVTGSLCAHMASLCT